MIKLFNFLIIISLLLTSCAFDTELSTNKGKKRYSKSFNKKLRAINKASIIKIRPSESMQAGIPKHKKLDFASTDYFVDDNKNYRNYKIKNSGKNSGFKTVDDDDYDDLSAGGVEGDENSEDNSFKDNNILSSGVYSGHFKIGKPYEAFGVSYSPQDYESFEEIGRASWYGAEFNGKKTANGETYNMGDLTAAHPTLALPAIVKVTNLENGKSQILRVNDRGPFAKNRIIDVSEKAAEMLGFKGKGTTEVKVELLREDTDALLQKLQIKN